MTPYTATGPNGTAKVTHLGPLAVLAGTLPWCCKYVPDGATGLMTVTSFHETRDSAVQEARVAAGVVELR